MPERDPLFGPWAAASIGEAVLVRTVARRPSYWLVPVERAGRAIGFVRVSLTGVPETAGVLYRDPARLEAAPALVTRIGAETAIAAARAAVPGAAMADEPVYVHDGPPGREAWMVGLRDPAGRTRTVFVTPGGAYEHDPTQHPSPEVE